MRILSFAVAVVAVSAGLLSAPADACGFKRMTTGRVPQATEVYSASVRGKVLIYKDAVDKRVEMALRSAGYQIQHGATVDSAAGANVILARADQASELPQQLSGVVVLVTKGAAGEATGGANKYVLREQDSVSNQLAMVGDAMKSAAKPGA